MKLQGCFFRMPIPPPARRLLQSAILISTQITGHGRSIIADMGQDLLQGIFETFAAPLAPLRQQGPAFAIEPVAPMGVERGRNNRGVMGPVLEQRSVLFQKAGQQRRPVGLVARKQNHVMGAGNRVDGVDLNKAEIMDDVLQPAAIERGFWGPT